jgi:5-methylcytosine-specific restriction endonuclease McrA
MLIKRTIAKTYTPRKVEKKTDPFYHSKEWRRIRSEVIRDNPTCEYCDIVSRARVVDHVLPRRLFPELELEKSNLKGSCDRCHNKKRNIEKKCKTREEAEIKLSKYILQ